MIIWREKLIALAVHFLCTLLVAAGAAILIFRVWFPDPFQIMVGGTKLFVLIVGCDLALGPLISLIIYDSRKSRRTLIVDYTVVAVIQILAIGYGVFSISKWRPVYVVFATDRLEVVSAGDLDPADVKAAASPYDSLPKWGPRLVAARPPEGAKAHNKALFDALAGKDIPLVPSYYVTYESQLPQIRAHAQTIAALEKVHPGSRASLEAGINISGTSADQLRWLPIKARTGFWTALIDANTAQPKWYVPFDPY